MLMHFITFLVQWYNRLIIPLQGNNAGYGKLKRPFMLIVYLAVMLISSHGIYKWRCLWHALQI